MFDCAMRIATATTTLSGWDGRQAWQVPTTTAVPNRKQHDAMRVLGLLSAFMLFYYDTTPSLIHPMLFKCLIDGIDNIRNWSFLKDQPSFREAAELLGKWPSTHSEPLPPAFSSYILDAYLGVRGFRLC